jgi:hypothetical protein
MDVFLMVLATYCIGYFCGRRDVQCDQKVVVNYPGMDKLTAEQIARGVVHCSWGAARRNR